MTASFIQSIQSNIVLWRDQTACKKRRIWLVTKQGLPSVCLRGWQRLDWKPIKQSNNNNQTASSLGMSAHHQIIIIIIVNELLGRFRLKRRNRCTAPPLLRRNQLQKHRRLYTWAVECQWRTVWDPSVDLSMLDCVRNEDCMDHTKCFLYTRRRNQPSSTKNEPSIRTVQANHYTKKNNVANTYSLYLFLTL